jgi:hypothetical protein
VNVRTYKITPAPHAAAAQALARRWMLAVDDTPVSDHLYRGEAIDLATKLASHDWLDRHLPAQVVLAPASDEPVLLEAHGGTG